MTDYAICRVSSSEQGIKGISIEVQQERLKSLGIDEKNIFVDSGRSGGVKEDDAEIYYENGKLTGIINIKSARPELRRLMDILKDGDSVTFTNWSRLSRDNVFLELLWRFCKRKNISLNPLDEPKEPSLIRRMITDVNMDLLERTMETNDKIFQKKFKSDFFPYKAPIGYIKNIKLDKGKFRFPDLSLGCLVIDEKKAEMVKDIFEMMSQGFFYKDICEKHQIEPKTIYSIIRNKTYLGFTHYGDDWTKSENVPQLIDEETFKKANENIKNN